MIDEHHVALPQLYGAPAYARPPRPVETDRPLDPDDLPLEVFRTDEERELASMLTDGTEVARDAHDDGNGRGHGLRPRPFSLRTLGRALGGRS